MQLLIYTFHTLATPNLFSLHRNHSSWTQKPGYCHCVAVRQVFHRLSAASSFWQRRSGWRDSTGPPCWCFYEAHPWLEHKWSNIERPMYGNSYHLLPSAVRDATATEEEACNVTSWYRYRRHHTLVKQSTAVSWFMSFAYLWFVLFAAFPDKRIKLYESS